MPHEAQKLLCSSNKNGMMIDGHDLTITLAKSSSMWIATNLDNKHYAFQH